MISVVGHTAVDHIFEVPSLPGPHDSTYICGHHVYYGGGAANIAAAIARLGGSAELVSAVGGDFAGSEYDAWMDSLGVKKRFFVVPESRTATCYLYNDEDGNQMTFFEWGASDAFSVSEAPSLDFVHMATADPEFNVQVAEKSTFASFDPGQDLLRYSAVQLDSICDNIDILFANHHEIERMADMLDTTPHRLVRRVPCAVVTCSGEGSVLYHDGDSERIPAVSVPLADPTGAGDAYRAGFLTAYTKGLAPAVCCRIGTVTASFVVEAVGCQTNLPDWGRMEERYIQHFGAL